MEKKKKLFIVVNSLDAFFSHRLPVALAAKKTGYDVKIIYGEMPSHNDSNLGDFGLKSLFLPIDRGGTNPFKDFVSIFLLWRLFTIEKPDLVHLVTIKPILYGGICARLAGVPAIISAITGMGFLFTDRYTVKVKALRQISQFLFKASFKHSNKIIVFQNDDDHREISNIVGKKLGEAVFIRGSGVDLAEYDALPESGGNKTIVMASRLLVDKGVYEFVQAAKILKKKYQNLRFLLAGLPDYANPASVSKKEVDTWGREGIVECLGFCNDVACLYRKSHIVVLPSYREGLPKSLLEAAACGRPIITTNVSGCRDAILPDITGILVPPKDPISLSNAIETLVLNRDLRKAMGEAGRSFAEKNFSINKVVEQHLKLYKKLLS